MNTRKSQSSCSTTYIIKYKLIVTDQTIKKGKPKHPDLIRVLRPRKCTMPTVPTILLKQDIVNCAGNYFLKPNKY